MTPLAGTAPLSARPLSFDTVWTYTHIRSDCRVQVQDEFGEQCYNPDGSKLTQQLWEVEWDPHPDGTPTASTWEPYESFDPTQEHPNVTLERTNYVRITMKTED